MYSTKTIHKNINPNYPQGYTSIGDPYNGNHDKLPDRWKEKQFVTQKLPKNADNGLFVKLKYNSEPYIEMSERVSRAWRARRPPFVVAPAPPSRAPLTPSATRPSFRPPSPIVLQDAAAGQAQAGLRLPRREQDGGIHVLEDH